MKYYLGIDGGGTRTTAAVSDESGNIIAKAVGKTINFYAVGMEASRKNLAEIIGKLPTFDNARLVQTLLPTGYVGLARPNFFGELPLR